ncbi:MAG: ATP-binding protein [Deltaproteobacteria bacterium]|nr:ATP-binding protein [Deltaproteobacteria bacterium]
MNKDYRENDYRWIKELMTYPQTLEKRLDFFEDTSQISVPEDPIEQVIFQDKAKTSIRKIAQNKGHILMVGRPGTGKSMLANMFNDVLDKSLGDYLRPKEAIVAYPGKDRNHILFAYEDSETIDDLLSALNNDIESAKNSVDEFSLSDQIKSVSRAKKWLLLATGITAAAGLFFPPAFIATGLTGIGSIFMYMQENNHKVQEKIQRETSGGKQTSLKHLYDMMPEILYDPRKDTGLMARISEPNARNMKGGFRHDPYQSGNLHTPAHKRAYLGAHAKAPIVYIDELKTLVKIGYMSDLLEIMQNKTYILEGGRETGSGAADKSENSLKADNILIACCNHDTLEYLQTEGDGSFLSRIEDKGEIIQMESAVPETEKTIREVAQYIKQEKINLNEEFKASWGEVLEKEGHVGVRVRSEFILGKQLPFNYKLEARDFSRSAVLEIVKELRCRASDGKLSSILRPVNGIIKTAEFEAILENSPLVEPKHVRRALEEHLSLEGALSKEIVEHKKDLKKFIASMTDSIGYVVGLAVINSKSSGQMYGQPLPIHGQINAGGSDRVTSSGKTGDIAKGAAQNVRASIKKIFKKICAPYIGYEMHVEYIQAHGGVEGDSASVAMDIALISDYIKQPVNQKYGVTGSLTGDIVLPVGGVTEKVRSIMDPVLGMKGACIPWQNKHDVEPLLINSEYEYIQRDEVPGLRIFRSEEGEDAFDIYFCKTKYNAYKIMMGLDREAVENRMAERSKKDLEFFQGMKNALKDMEEAA